MRKGHLLRQEIRRGRRPRGAAVPKKMAVADAIGQMVRTIVEQFQPERIILFGSHARGTAGPDSDVDLLIVMPVMGSKWEKAIEIGAALGRIPVSKDILVTTPEEFEWRKEIPGTIERPAALEGKILYARA
jgi:predicted nucleotidyltransferase